MRTFGLIGYPLSHSFSPSYFNQKFKNFKIEAIYKAFEIESINKLNEVLVNNPNLEGLNVTIPYKESVISYLHHITKEAQKIGAVNCIKIENINNKPYLIGYNTDVIGFEKSLIPLLKKHHTKALIIGNGGASKAVAFVLNKLQIPYNFLVRSKKHNHEILFNEADKDLIEQCKLIINTTPLGTYPNIDICPNIPYEAINEQHLLYDLIYNPSETLFLKKGLAQGAQIKNGYEMLLIQAEACWKIWNNAENM